jgi:hypothetical protein
MLHLHKVVVGPAAIESAIEPLHAVANPAATGTAQTKTSCLCVLA